LFFYQHAVPTGLEPLFIDLSTNMSSLSGLEPTIHRSSTHMSSAAADLNHHSSIFLPTCRPPRRTRTHYSLFFYQHAVPTGLEPTIHRSFYQHVVPIGTLTYYSSFFYPHVIRLRC